MAGSADAVVLARSAAPGPRVILARTGRETARSVPAPHNDKQPTRHASFAPQSRARTQAGIVRARELGVAFGRPPRLNAKQKRLIATRYAGGETMRELAIAFDVSEPTVWRALRSEPA